MKKTTASKPWQDHATKSLCRVAETAGCAAVALGAAWAFRRWLYQPCATGNATEPQPEQQEIQNHIEDESTNIIAREKLSDVAGLEEVKAELREKVIEPFTRPELFQRFKLKHGGGVLMYGPPGNGKTFIARAIAGEVNAKFLPVNTAEIKSKWVGETEKNLQRLFDEAKRHTRAVVFLDEVDNLLAARGNRKIGAVTQFLQITDGLIKAKNCLLTLAATNKPWVLDEAVIRPGRLGTHVFVGPPDLKAREAILKLNLDGVPVADGVNLGEIAAGTGGYSGADLAELCDHAKRAAKNRQICSRKDEVVTKDDFDEAAQKIHPSVSLAQLRQFETWRENRQRLTVVEDDED